LLWNDTRSAKEALDLNQEFGGAQATADAVGSYLVASFTATKLRWIADHEPDSAKKIAAVCLPHDFLSWKLGQSNQISNLFTDRSDASGTGYFDSKANEYRNDFLKIALRGQFAQLPKVLKPNEVGGEFKGIQIAPGAGDNAGAALGVGAEPGDVVVSLGTSGTAFAVSETSTHDPSGQVAGFADATGKFLPLVCTLNAARILDAACNLLKVSHAELSDLALSAPAGANGLTLLPYFEGERTPNRPNARGTLNGLSNKNSDPPSIARSYIEGMICGLADAVDALSNLGVAVNRIFLVGGAAKNPAVARIAASIFGRTVLIPPPGEYVANGAARQAAWTFSGELPNWEIGKIEQIDSVATPEVFTRYKDLVIKTENF
jgi:xylulokinase